MSKVSKISVKLNLRVTVSAAGCSAASGGAELAWWIPRVVSAFSLTAVIPWPAAKKALQMIWCEKLFLTVHNILMHHEQSPKITHNRSKYWSYLTCLFSRSIIHLSSYIQYIRWLEMIKLKYNTNTRWKVFLAQCTLTASLSKLIISSSRTTQSTWIICPGKVLMTVHQ